MGYYITQLAQNSCIFYITQFNQSKQMDISYFTTLQVGWLNAWIPPFGMMVNTRRNSAIVYEKKRLSINNIGYID